MTQEKNKFVILNWTHSWVPNSRGLEALNKVSHTNFDRKLREMWAASTTNSSSPKFIEVAPDFKYIQWWQERKRTTENIFIVPEYTHHLKFCVASLSSSPAIYGPTQVLMEGQFFYANASIYCTQYFSTQWRRSDCRSGDGAHFEWESLGNRLQISNYASDADFRSGRPCKKVWKRSQLWRLSLLVRPKLIHGKNRNFPVCFLVS